MIAKKNIQIFNRLINSSLQSSLQKCKLYFLQIYKCLHFSLPFFKLLQTHCKEIATQYQILTIKPFAVSVYKNTNL